MIREYEVPVRIRHGFPAIAKFTIAPAELDVGYPGGIDEIVLYTTRGQRLNFFQLTQEEEAALAEQVYYSSDAWESI